MNRNKLLLTLAIVAIVGIFIGFEGHQLLTLENLKSHQASIGQWIDQNLVLAVSGYAAIYILVTALALPGATIMTRVSYTHMTLPTNRAG